MSVQAFLDLASIEELRKKLAAMPLEDEFRDAREELIREVHSSLNVLSQQHRAVTKGFKDLAVDHVVKFDDVDLGGGKRIGVSYEVMSGLTDRYGAIEAVLDAMSIPEAVRSPRKPYLISGFRSKRPNPARELAARVLDDVLPKTKSSPLLKTGMKMYDAPVGALFYPSGKQAIPVRDRDGKKVLNFKVKDEKYSKKPKAKSAA